MSDMTPEQRDTVYKMEEALWALVKRRIVVTSVLLAVAGIGGIWGTIELVVQRVAETPLKSLQKEIMRAEIQAEAAKRASDTAQASSEQVNRGLTTLNTTLANLAGQAKAIEGQFKLVKEEINASSENARLRSQQDFSAIQRRIVALETLVKQIGEDSAASRKAAAEYAKQIAALESKIDREQKRFAENSSYSVSIFFHPSRKATATEVQSRLAALGFRASAHETSSDTSKGNALTYQGQIEAKAQEVLAFLKPVLKDIEMKKIEPAFIKKPWSEDISKLKSDPKTNWGLDFGILALWHEPKGMMLRLGAS